MSYIKTCKSIRMDNEAFGVLKNANYLLETMSLELKDIAKSDDYFSDLANSIWKAHASLDDFLEEYQETINPS